MKLYDVNAVPKPVRRLYALGKWRLLRIPFALQYEAALLQNAPIERLVQLLPTPTKPTIYWVELKKVKLHASLHYQPGKLCMEGDWDINMTHPLPSIFKPAPKSAKKWDLHETVRGMFLLGKTYKATPQYASMVEAVKRKSVNPPQGCRTMEQVHLYFRQLIKAFDSMQKSGYLTQEELGMPSSGEIRLHLTRNGSLCLGGGGNHRIRMAEILGIQWVPFILRGVHPALVVQLSQQYTLPPHKALAHWLTSNFPIIKPKASEAHLTSHGERS